VSVGSPVRKAEGKVTHASGRGGSYGSETSRLPHCLDVRLTDDGEIISLRSQLSFIPRRFLVLISVRDSVYLRAIASLKGLT
jgi:hypothetical protein